MKEYNILNSFHNMTTFIFGYQASKKSVLVTKINKTALRKSYPERKKAQLE
jgi:hypothetical protein